MHTYIHTYIYIYIYVYTFYTHTYIYIYTHTPLLVEGGAFSYRHCPTRQVEFAQPKGDQLSVFFPLVLLPVCVCVCVFGSATLHPKPFLRAEELLFL